MKLRMLAYLLITYGVQASDVFSDIEYGDNRAIAQWLKSDQDINQVNKDGQTVLIKAVMKENKKLVKKLLTYHDIDVNIIDAFGNAALDYAVQQENKALVRMLVKKKAMVTTDCNAIKCQKLLVKRSWGRILEAVLLGIIGLAIVSYFGTGFILAGLMSTNGGSMVGLYSSMSLFALSSVGVAYGIVRRYQNSDSYSHAVRARLL